MWRMAAALGMAALTTGVAAAARVEPIKVETRAEALAELKAAIQDELRAIDLIEKVPPRIETARERLDRSHRRLGGISDYLSTVPGATAAENAVGSAGADDWAAYGLISTPGGPDELGRSRAIEFLERALLSKRGALRVFPDARPAAAPQCADGKDNDGDGLVDAKTEPGCTSAGDARERSPFRCAVGSSMASGRLSLSGSCSGAFAELEVTLLDGVQLNGRFDVQHAPSCRPPEPTRFRCSAKNGDQNPDHVVSMQLATTSKDPAQRVALRFFDAKRRPLGRFVTARR
jgi:hypothetical protein